MSVSGRAMHLQKVMAAGGFAVCRREIVRGCPMADVRLEKNPLTAMSW